MNDSFDLLLAAAISGDTSAVEKLRRIHEGNKNKGGRPPNSQRNFELSMWIEAACEKFGWKRNQAFERAGEMFKTATKKGIGDREARREHAKLVGRKRKLQFWVFINNNDGVLCIGSTAALDRETTVMINPTIGCREHGISLRPASRLQEGKDVFLVFFEKSTFA